MQRRYCQREDISVRAILNLLSSNIEVERVKRMDVEDSRRGEFIATSLVRYLNKSTAGNIN